MSAVDLPEWATWRAGATAYSLGIEEEVMLLDPADLSLVYEFDRIRPRLSQELAARMRPETHGAAVELATAPHSRAGDAGAELTRLRAAVVDELAIQEIGVACAGTHPRATWTASEISEGERYRYVHRTMRELARREPTFALHVHVGVPDPEQATAIATRMRAHLPLLLAISANSPFWQGRDSGLASARTPIFNTFPRSGIPRSFRDYRDYAQTLALLIDCGAFPEETFVWWDLRLQPRLGTIEIRIMDAQTESWRTTALAALVQCLVRLEATEGYAADELVANPELLEENHFRAFRDGASGSLIDPVARGLEPVAELAQKLLAACARHARELDCEAELVRIEELLALPGDVEQRRLAGSPPDFMRVLEAARRRFASTDREPPTA